VSADPGRAPRAHRIRAKIERGIWVLFHVENSRLMVAGANRLGSRRPSPALHAHHGSIPRIIVAFKVTSCAEIKGHETGFLLSASQVFQVQVN
jgi:hypothetical protein